MPTSYTAALFVAKETPSVWLKQLDGDLSVSRHTIWRTFDHASRRVEVAGILAPVLDEVTAGRAAALKVDRPSLPLVIVALLTADNARTLNRLPRVEAVLLDDEAVGNLHAVLNEAAAHGLLLRAASWIDAETGLTDLLRETLAMACRKRRPVRSVNALSRTVLGGTPQALWDLWHASMPEEVKPHGFIDWLLVAHAIGFTSKRESERAASIRLGVKQTSSARQFDVAMAMSRLTN